MNLLDTQVRSNGEVCLDKCDMYDIVEAYTTIPNLVIARDAFISMVLRCPASIQLKTLRAKESKRLQILLELYYLPWKIDCYDYLQMFGIAPWYWKKIDDDEYVPVVPPLLSGYFSTYMDSKNQQQFRFYYNNSAKPVTNMYFETNGHAPTICGKFRSVVSTIIPEFKTSKILRQAFEITTYQQARPQHIFEFHPPRNVPGDDNLVTLESFGDTIAASVMTRQENLHMAKMNIRKDDMQRALLYENIKNKGQKQKYGTRRYLLNEDRTEEWERDNSTVLSRGIPLGPDFVYKAAASPQLHADYARIMQRLDHLSSAIMDVPLSWIETSTTRTVAGVQGSIRFVNERIKSWIEYFVRITKKAFLIGNGTLIQEQLDFVRRRKKKLSEQELISIYADEEVDVYISCSPIAHVNDVRQTYYDGFMKKEKAAEHIFSILGIPITDINISEQPPIMSTIPKMSTSKDAVE